MRNFLIVVVLMALSFGGGFLWAHERAGSVQRVLDVANAQLAQQGAAMRLYQLQDQLLTLVEDTANKNYGDAAAVSTKFFDTLNGEASRATQPGLKSALQSILTQRDQVTAQLAKGDPASHDAFVQMLTTLHHAIDGVTPAPSATSP